MARFLALHPKKIDLSLDRMWHVLGALGDPHKKLPPVIHVAGTNGKGSTIAFMRAMLEAAGRRVHVFTSPHLVRFHERIRLGAPGGGRLVSEAMLVDAFGRAEAANGQRPITVFEITTAAALLLFSEMPADVLLLEVGLGGRYDATNVVARPLASVITPVSLDHMEYLGDTIGKAMRAVAHNPSVAALMGINVTAMMLGAYALSSALAGIGGLLVAPIASASLFLGMGIALKAFSGAIMGGLDNPPR